MSITPSLYDIESPSKMHDHGQIQLILGPMFSGKTTELIRRLRRYQVAKHRCFIIKYAKDNRYSNSSVSSHDHQTLSAVAATQLTPLSDVSDKFSVVGVDEAQFFPDCVDFAESLANRGKIVILSALDSTFQRQSFGAILRLVPLAESIVKLNAVCMMCYRTASFTKRIGSETQLEVIGGAEKYMSVCRRCYFQDCTATGNQSQKSITFSDDFQQQ